MVTLNKIKWREISEEEFDRIGNLFESSNNMLHKWCFTNRAFYHLPNSIFAVLRIDTHFNGEEGDWFEFYVAEQYYTIMDILKGDTNMLCVLGPMLMNVEG